MIDDIRSIIAAKLISLACSVHGQTFVDIINNVTQENENV